jgi:hypothetical protein
MYHVAWLRCFGPTNLDLASISLKKKHARLSAEIVFGTLPYQERNAKNIPLSRWQSTPESGKEDSVMDMVSKFGLMVLATSVSGKKTARTAKENLFMLTETSMKACGPTIRRMAMVTTNT